MGSVVHPTKSAKTDFVPVRQDVYAKTDAVQLVNFAIQAHSYAWDLVPLIQPNVELHAVQRMKFAEMEFVQVHVLEVSRLVADNVANSTKFAITDFVHVATLAETTAVLPTHFAMQTTDAFSGAPWLVSAKESAANLTKFV
jgi:hypothetical protein